MLVLQFWQWLKVSQNAHPGTLQSWQTPLLKEYPVRQEVQTVADALQFAQLGTEHFTQFPPLSVYPGMHPTHTEAEVQFPQFDKTHGKQLEPLSKYPVLQTEH